MYDTHVVCARVCGLVGTVGVPGGAGVARTREKGMMHRVSSRQDADYLPARGGEPPGDTDAPVAVSLQSWVTGTGRLKIFLNDFVKSLTLTQLKIAPSAGARRPLSPGRACVCFLSCSRSCRSCWAGTLRTGAPRRPRGCAGGSAAGRKVSPPPPRGWALREGSPGPSCLCQYLLAVPSSECSK